MDNSKDTDSETRKCLVGICCMDAKGRSKHMLQILNRLETYGNFQMVFFGDDTILNKPTQEWPEVDVLLTFYSTGFPLAKAIEYVRLHPNIYCINDPQYQHLLLDRRTVYAMLKKSHIPMVKHVVVDRTSSAPLDFKEFPNHIEVNGVVLEKPFVEKPVDGEDHNIYIYYHENTGGGSVRLFRKVGNKSSQAYPDVNNVRTEGSYIYEEFVMTDQNQDVKMYTVTPSYIHVESRKSPVVDGHVERDRDGKEIRFILETTKEEAEIARRIVRCFHQGICGFDVLRRNGQSFVCDVNGWSFVKGNARYYDNCAKILAENLLGGFRLRGFKLVKPIENKRILRGVVGIWRHADRTPKQKLKFKITNKDILSFFENPRNEIKLKNDSNQVKLNKLLNIAKGMLESVQATIANAISNNTGIVSPSPVVATSTGNVSPGIERPTSPGKILPYLLSNINPNATSGVGIELGDAEKLELLVIVLEKGYDGTKVQLKPLKWTVADGKEYVEQALFICKWGGVLTDAGIKQARAMGKEIGESVIPKDKSREDFITDIEFISNNERRVKRTAEEFAKSLFGKENLSNDFVRDTKQTAAMLGMTIPGKRLMERMKKQLNEMMHLYKVDDFVDIPGIKQLGNPLEMMQEVLALMQDITEHLRINPSHPLCNGESFKIFQQRWIRLRKNFYNSKTHTFDTTKIPDIFDYITYDVTHNRKGLQEHDLYPIVERAETMARFLVPAEYGINPKDKFDIASLICQTLVNQFLSDMKEIYANPIRTSAESPRNKKAKVRLYFASESHLHTLKNALLHSGVTHFRTITEPVELNYLTHFIFKLWENVDLEPMDPRRYQIEVLFSSGTASNPFGVKTANLNNENHVLHVLPKLSIHPNLLLSQFEEIVNKVNENHQTLVQAMGEHKETVPH